MKLEPNKVKILNENVDMQAKSKYVLACIERSKAQSRVGIVQNDICIAKNFNKRNSHLNLTDILQLK